MKGKEGESNAGAILGSTANSFQGAKCLAGCVLLEKLIKSASKTLRVADDTSYRYRAFCSPEQYTRHIRRSLLLLQHQLKAIRGVLEIIRGGGGRQQFFVLGVEVFIRGQAGPEGGGV